MNILNKTYPKSLLTKVSAFVKNNFVTSDLATGTSTGQTELTHTRIAFSPYQIAVVYTANCLLPNSPMTTRYCLGSSVTHASLQQTSSRAVAGVVAPMTYSTAIAFLFTTVLNELYDSLFRRDWDAIYKILV